MNRTYKRCVRCVMTEKGDPHIRFDDNGVCNYCTDAFNRMKTTYFPNEDGQKKMERLVARLKEKNKHKKYDCVMGMSGGLDSSYLAYVGAVKYGLRIKALHIDDGFDTELAQTNIRSLCEKAGIDIEYIYPDSQQFCDLSRAYMLAGVPNLAVPQDNVLVSALYRFMRKYGINDFLCGDNFSLECILQEGNTWDSQDLTNIRAINKKFGRGGIDKLPLQSLLTREIYSKLKLINEYTPLNYLDYNKKRAISELHEFSGYEYYEAKHLENYFTGFLQLYWLPKKFGVDKRTSHLSSLIVTGQMSRDEALDELESKPYTDEWMDKAIAMIKQKLDISDEEFERIMNGPTHQHMDYDIDFFKKVKRMVIKR